jgi:hypothetical protein
MRHLQRRCRAPQLQTVAGEVAITQQLHDRGVSGGGAFDQIIAKQLGQQLAEKLNLCVLQTVISGGASVSGSASFSIANLYQGFGEGQGAADRHCRCQTEADARVYHERPVQLCDSSG